MSFGTYDFETYQWTKPICFGMYYERLIPGFPDNPIPVKDFFIDRHSNLHVAVYGLKMLEEASFADEIKTWWAHNGGKYDILFFIDALKHPSFAGWKCDGSVAAGRVISLRINSGRCSFELKDSFAVIQSSLDKALESFEIPVKKVFTKADYEAIEHCPICETSERLMQGKKLTQFVTRHTCMLSHSDEKLEVGCLADCEGLYGLLQKAQSMFEEWGGALKSTFSSSALSVVKASIGKPLPSHEGNQWANDVCRNAYHGGRVEVYKHKPKGLLREYDINSSYPASMSKPLPWELLGYGKPDLYAPGQMSVIYATVNVPKQYIPPLPYVPASGGLFFPYGIWSAWFTSVELQYAIEKCGVDATFHEAINYSTETHFEPFIDKVFKVKAESKGAKREFTKLVLNGCYGKFGQKPENSKLKVFASRADAIAWEYENASKNPEQISPDGTALSHDVFRWPKQTHYAMASTITAYSRILLHSYLTGRFNLSYCDTDSIHCTKDPMLDSFCNDKLGNLKVELDEYQGRFYAPKLYRLNPESGKVVYASKGFPVSAEAFERIVRGEHVGNPKGRMQLIKTMLKRGANVTHLDEDQTAKVWSGRSNKRFAIPGNPEGDTQPWNVRELQEGKHIDQQSPISKAKP